MGNYQRLLSGFRPTPRQVGQTASERWANRSFSCDECSFATADPSVLEVMADLTPVCPGCNAAIDADSFTSQVSAST